MYVIPIQCRMNECELQILHEIMHIYNKNKSHWKVILKGNCHLYTISYINITGVISGGVRHRLSVGSASALSCGGEKYVRSGRTGEGQAGGCGREKEDDTKSAENVSRGVLPSRQSLLDLVSGKFMGRHTPTHHYYHQQQQQVGYRPRSHVGKIFLLLPHSSGENVLARTLCARALDARYWSTNIFLRESDF